MDKMEKREWVNRLAVLLAHLLKWRFQADVRGPSLRRAIDQQRYEVADHLEIFPGLLAIREEAIKAAYRNARVEAERETGLPRSVFPVACPWNYGQTMDDSFWPDT